MNVSKTKVFLIICLILVLSGSYYLYEKKFFINDCPVEIHDKTEQWLNNCVDFNMNIDIKKTADLESWKILMFQSGPYLGEIILEKGLNKKYCIDSTTFNDSFIRSRYFENKDKRWFILSGTNPDNSIHYIRITINSHNYDICVKNQEFFLELFEIPDDLKFTKQHPDDLCALNEKKEDITYELMMKLNNDSKENLSGYSISR